MRAEKASQARGWNRMREVQRRAVRSGKRAHHHAYELPLFVEKRTAGFALLRIHPQNHRIGIAELAILHRATEMHRLDLTHARRIALRMRIAERENHRAARHAGIAPGKCRLAAEVLQLD